MARCVFVNIMGSPIMYVVGNTVGKCLPLLKVFPFVAWLAFV